MRSKSKGRWIGVIFSLLACCGTVQTALAWDMIPPSESVRNAADEFNPDWLRGAD